MDEHCKAINRAVTNSDHVTLSTLLSLYSGGKQLLVRLCKELSAASLSGMVNAVASIIDDNWREVTLNHLRALKATLNDAPKDAFAFQLDVVQAVLREILPRGDKSMLPVIYVITMDLWNVAVLCADDECEEEAARAINKAFTVCITDRSALPSSRKHGCYKLLSLLMRIYFHRNQLTLCTQLLRALKTADMPDERTIPKAHMTCFHYYHGRFLLSSGRYLEAFEQLRRAFILTKSAVLNGSIVANGNLLKIYRFYVVVHVACHPNQRPRLLPDTPFILCDLFNAIATGKILEFRGLLKGHFSWLTKHELYVLLQRFDIIVIRNAIKRIHDCAEPSLVRTKLHLHLIYTLTDGKDVWPLGVHQMSSHLCSLVTMGVIKGYVSLSPPYLVLSSKDPFPLFRL